MSDTCQLKITSSFKAGLWEWCDMLAGFGYIYRKTAVFVDGSEVPINITADGFSAKIYNSLGVLVDTLLLGTDLVVVGTNKLNILLGPPVTTLAGTYKGVLVWTQPRRRFTSGKSARHGSLWVVALMKGKSVAL